MEEKILEIVNIVLKNRDRKEIKELKHSMHLRNDLNFDSLDLAELTVRIEAEFGIDIFEKGIVNTIGEIIDNLNNDK